MKKKDLLQSALMLEQPDRSGWWYCVSKYHIRVCFVNVATDRYSYIGKEGVSLRTISIQEGLLWLKPDSQECNHLSEMFGNPWEKL
jgi:hypothetical protein